MNPAQFNQDDASVSAMLHFFLPLAVTSVLMMASHSLASSAMVKTREPALALASFSIAQSLGLMFEGTVTVTRPLGLALIKNRQTWSVVAKLMQLVVAAVVAVMALISFTPLGVVVFSRVLGAPADVAAEAVRVFRLFLIFPAESCLRFTYHSIILLFKKTVYTTIAMIGRIAVMITATAILIANPPALGGAAGAIVLLSGIGTEAIISFLAGRHLVSKLDDLSKGQEVPRLSLQNACKFYLPLAISGVVANLSRLSLSAGLSRTLEPKISLAAYQVSWTLVWVFVSPVTALHQVTVVFAKNPESSARVKRFGLAVGMCSASLLLLFVLSGAARTVLSRWIGVTQELVGPALWSIGLMVVMPFITCWSELFTGALLASGDSISIGTGRTIYVIVLSLASLLGASLVPALGAALAPISMLVGSFAEMVYLFGRVRRLAGSRFGAILPGRWSAPMRTASK